MKRILPIVFALSILTSCGPKRLGCGPRGICKTTDKEILSKPQKTNSSKTNG